MRRYTTQRDERGIPDQGFYPRRDGWGNQPGISH